MQIMSNEFSPYKDHLEKINPCNLGLPVTYRETIKQGLGINLQASLRCFCSELLCCCCLNKRKDNGNKFFKDRTLYKGQGTFKCISNLGDTER